MGKSYRDLVAWQQAMKPAMATYRRSRQFPKQEMFGLTAQIRRSAISVPSNIAEGQGRFSPREFRQFLSHAMGSLMELETQAILARELGYWKNDEADEILELAARVGRLANGLVASLEKQPKDPE